jgi:hypothetical protein
MPIALAFIPGVGPALSAAYTYGSVSHDVKKAKEAAAAQQAQLLEQMKSGSLGSKDYSEEDLANVRAFATDLASRGKIGTFDPSDTALMSTYLASPGDENYVEGLSVGGQDIDPFPRWLRNAGDTINSTIDETGQYMGDYLGSADQRMYDFMPILDRMKGMNLDAMSTLGSIFDEGEGGLESQYRGFQDDFNTLAEGQKVLNQMTAESNQGLVDNVLNAGDRYSQSIADSKNLQTDLTNASFDALSSLEDIKRMRNLEQTGRFADTRDARQNAAFDLSNAEYGAATGLSDAEYGAANRLFDSRSDEAGGILGARGREAGGIFGAETDSARGIFDAQMGAADRIQNAERAKSLAAGANAENLANAGQRGMRSAMVGQGTGTTQNMGNAMIRAQLGQQRSDMLADTLIRDADRRGQADIGLAESLGQSGIDFADRMGSADVDYFTDMGAAGVDRADQLGASDIGLAGRLGQSNINLADRVGGAETQYRTQMEDILYSDADKLGSEIEADRYATLAELNPGEGNVLASQADLQNQLRALGYGDQMLNAMGANIGIDQATLDDERKLLSDLTNMRLGNTSLIPALGMQYAQLPATLLESALAPMGPLVRNASPYTTTGQLPAPITTFSPIAPPTQDMQWYDYAQMAPSVINGIRSIGDIWGGGE